MAWAWDAARRWRCCWPARRLSLPSIAVIYSVLGFKKTAMFVFLTVIMSAIVGMVFGWFFV